MSEIWIATHNLGKLREYERLFSEKGIIVKSTKDLPTHSAPPENGKTFEENARIKTKSVRSIKNKEWVLGEDSGLEVPGLGGLPGIHSARYAGPNAKDTENVLKLIKMLHLKGVQDRSAQFKCVVVVHSPEGKEYVFEGVLKGTIAKEPKGKDGFGYDSVFIPDGETKTLAELGLAVKNKLSHRAKAAEQIIAKLFS